MTDDMLRSGRFAALLNKREDEAQRRLIEKFDSELEFEPVNELMISTSAWGHVLALNVAPRFVFTHPDILQKHPTTSLYYRGIALLS